MSPGLPCFYLDGPGFPRVSGDEPAYTPGAWAVDMFSPRERG